MRGTDGRDGLRDVAWVGFKSILGLGICSGSSTIGVVDTCIRQPVQLVHLTLLTRATDMLYQKVHRNLDVACRAFDGRSETCLSLMDLHLLCRYSANKLYSRARYFQKFEESRTSKPMCSVHTDGDKPRTNELEVVLVTTVEVEEQYND